MMMLMFVVTLASLANIDDNEEILYSNEKVRPVATQAYAIVSTRVCTVSCERSFVPATQASTQHAQAEGAKKQKSEGCIY